MRALQSRRAEVRKGIGHCVFAKGIRELKQHAGSMPPAVHKRLKVTPAIEAKFAVSPSVALKGRHFGRKACNKRCQARRGGLGMSFCQNTTALLSKAD